MGRLQAVLGIIVALLAPPAFADWGVLVGTGGFQGETFVGPTYLPSPHHEIALTVGQFQVGDESQYQLNLGYTYTPGRIDIGPIAWAPFSIGLSTLYATNRSDYFVVSPSRYPTSGYYEETGLRFALRVGTEISWQRLHFGYEVAAIDSGFTAVYNNHWRDLESFLSATLRLRYDF